MEPRKVPTVALALIAALAALALTLAACGDDDGGGTTSSVTEEVTGGDTSAEPGVPSGNPDDVVSTTLDPDSGGSAIPDLPDNDDPAAVQCTGDPKGIVDATAFVGESVGAASQTAAEAGCEVRVVREDGKSLPITQDLRPDRINVAVEDGQIVKVDGIY